MYKVLIIFSLALFSSLNIHLHAQNCEPGEIPCTLEFLTDVYGYEFSWLAVSQTGDTLASSFDSELLTDQGFYENSTLFFEQFCIPSDECVRLILLDSYNDGFTNGGYVRFTAGGNELFLLTNYGGSHQEYFNCEPGFTCDDPFTITDFDFTMNVDERWFILNVDSIGQYEISTCNNPDGCDTEIFVYYDCPIVIQENVEGTIFYNDSNDECGERAMVINSINAGQDYIVRIQRNEQNCGAEINVKIKYIGEIEGCTDPNACNYDPLATIDDGSCYQYGDPECPKGPDLRLNPFVLASSMFVETIDNVDQCLVEEGCIRGVGVRDIVRFSTRIENVGELDYFIGDPADQADQFTYDNCHNHFHYDGYAQYSLYDVSGQHIPIGYKNGFCVLDLECPSPGMSKYRCDYMGITAGCADIYDSYIDCQWLDITDVPDGDYVFVAVVNVDLARDALGRAETDTLNNYAHVCISFDRSSGVLQVTQDPDCEPYVDCAGLVYGNAEVDCEGNCGGSRKRGDLNLDQLHGMLDVAMYVDLIMNKETATDCNDLYADADINVYDAALLQSCIIYGLEHDHSDGTTAHNHCFFPGGINNFIDTISIDVKHDYVNDPEYLYIDITNPSDGLQAFQLEISGAEIEQVLQNTILTEQIFEFFVSEDGVFLLAMPIADASLDRSNMEQGLLKIKIDRTAEMVCIENVILVADNDQLIAHKFTTSCAETGWTSSVDNILDAKDLELYPNPASDKLNIYIDSNSFIPESISFLTLNGETVFADNLVGKNYEVDVKEWAEGMYFVLVNGKDAQYTKKFIIQHDR